MYKITISKKKRITFLELFNSKNWQLADKYWEVSKWIGYPPLIVLFNERKEVITTVSSRPCHHYSFVPMDFLVKSFLFLHNGRIYYMPNLCIGLEVKEINDKIQLPILHYPKLKDHVFAGRFRTWFLIQYLKYKLNKIKKTNRV